MTNLRGFDLTALMYTYGLYDLNQCMRNSRQDFLSIQPQGKLYSIALPRVFPLYCIADNSREPWLGSSKIVYNTN